MKIVDFHCDTISQLYDLKQSGENINLKENKLHLDLNKMKKSDYMLQVFSNSRIFSHLSILNYL